MSAATDEALNVVSSDAMATLVAERRASVAARGRRSDLVVRPRPPPPPMSPPPFENRAPNRRHQASETPGRPVLPRTLSAGSVLAAACSARAAMGWRV